jgi:hypothetical protein
MIEVAGVWELGWSAPITEIEHWVMAVRSFGVERINMTPVSGVECRLLDEHLSMPDLIKAKPHLTPVFVDECGEVELRDFEHPEDALYIFGKANYAPYRLLGMGHLSVRIDCSLMGMMWPHQAMCVALYDRLGK